MIIMYVMEVLYADVVAKQNVMTFSLFYLFFHFSILYNHNTFVK